MNTNNLNDIRYLRIQDVLRIIPIGKSTFYKRVKSGEYPKPYKIAERTVAWKYTDIEKLSKEISERNHN